MLFIKAVWIQDNVLLDGKDQRSDCATLSRWLVSSKTNQNNGKELVDSVKSFSHNNANI